MGLENPFIVWLQITFKVNWFLHSSCTINLYFFKGNYLSVTVLEEHSPKTTGVSTKHPQKVIQDQIFIMLTDVFLPLCLLICTTCSSMPHSQRTYKDNQNIHLTENTRCPECLSLIFCQIYVDTSWIVGIVLMTVHLYKRRHDEVKLCCLSLGAQQKNKCQHHFCLYIFFPLFLYIQYKYHM